MAPVTPFVTNLKTPHSPPLKYIETQWNKKSTQNLSKPIQTRAVNIREHMIKKEGP